MLTRHALLLALVGALAVALRLGLILSPYGWLEADEAVVGLMARHILEGERPVFYWGQSYMGALEAYTAAAAFAFLGSSTFVLRLVPLLYSLGFIVLSYVLARRLFGPGPALLTATYLAVPPFMLALWSVKPRGGYAELLFLGQAILLLTLAVADARRPALWSLALGLVAGLALWTNQLVVIYLAPAAAYLLLSLRARLASVLAPGLVGLVVGALPLVIATASSGPAMAGAFGGTVGTPALVAPNFLRLWRIALPVLLGLGQPTSNFELFQADWATRPASFLPVTALGDLLVVAGLWPYRQAVADLVRGQPGLKTGPALLVGVFVAALVLLPFTNFRVLLSEPRYALPLYSVVPLYAALAWRLLRRPRLFAMAIALPLVLNGYSLATADPWLAQPTTAGRSTPETRAELLAFLEGQGLDRLYADYWLAYPLAFESDERVVAAVLSNGFNRFVPYAHLVHVAPRPAFVLVSGSPEAASFYEQMHEAGATGTIARVAIYDVVYDVQPLEPLRP